MAKVRPKTYFYHTATRWERERRGYLASTGKPNLEIGAPPEFRGHEGIWNPELLFVASIESCILTTFIAFSKGLDFLSYESKAEGRLDLIKEKMSFMFTRVTVAPRVVVARPEDVQRARDAMAKAEARCLVSNSVRTEIVVRPEIVVQPELSVPEG
jgi:organic hydroperoxide reductase OsmC/OhrA